MKMKRNISKPAAQCLLAISGALAMTVVHSQTVISEVLYDAVGTDNGNVFVELFGTPGAILDGLLLEGVNGADGSVYSSITLSGVIPADGVFIIGDDSGDGTTLVGNADLVMNVDFQNGPDSVVLRNTGGVLDALGYGDFTGGVFAGEGNAAPDVPGGISLARVNPLLDSNNNLTDFMSLDVPTPGSVPVSAVPLPPAVMLFLSGMAGLVGVARRRA
jgi:hypothetical protein